MAKYEADAALRRDGVIDPTLDAISKESQRSIKSHLADYESKLQAANCTEQHVNSTVNFIRWIADHAGYKTAADISADGVNRYAGKLRDEGRAARTIQAHLSAIKSFTKWLTENHKLTRDSLSSVKKPNPKADRRRERRMLLPDEWWRLEAATLTGPVRYGSTGSERVLLYRTAIQTGLRSNELRSLTRGRLYSDATPPYITCKSGSTKNREDARQFIQPDLAADLQAHVTKKAPKAPMFHMPHEADVADMIRADLADVRRNWLKEANRDPEQRMKREQSDFLVDVNHEGERFDFHSLRHTCGAWLAMTGAHPKVVQQVMRHASITLTMDTYGHLFPGQEADAVGRMQDLLVGPPEALQATGTDDASAGSQETRSARRSSQDAKQCVHDAIGCDDQSRRSARKTSSKHLHVTNLGEDVRCGATDDEEVAIASDSPALRIDSLFQADTTVV